MFNINIHGKNCENFSFGLCSFLTLPATVYAAGMVPETTLLMIDEANHGGVMSVKNTDSIPTLLYTSINDIEGRMGSSSTSLSRLYALSGPGTAGALYS